MAAYRVKAGTGQRFARECWLRESVRTRLNHPACGGHRLREAAPHLCSSLSIQLFIMLPHVQANYMDSLFGQSMIWAQAEALVSADCISSSQQSHASCTIRSARCCSAEAHFLQTSNQGDHTSRGGGGRMQVPTLSQRIKTRLAVRTGEQRCGARLGAKTHFRAALLGHPTRARAVAIAADVP